MAVNYAPVDYFISSACNKGACCIFSSLQQKIICNLNNEFTARCFALLVLAFEKKPSISCKVERLSLLYRRVETNFLSFTSAAFLHQPIFVEKIFHTYICTQQTLQQPTLQKF
ncbi:conserved hypothetical protein [Trichinella spiralis]|uniref:hypothetical protein n=1 Tax=Trichinella spiralis TaxID=6334 RepID=UPI0001EFC385|nr:conserved hypothetical protein [Trichinella spiralis]